MTEWRSEGKRFTIESDYDNVVVTRMSDGAVRALDADKGGEFLLRLVKRCSVRSEYLAEQIFDLLGE